MFDFQDYYTHLSSFFCRPPRPGLTVLTEQVTRRGGGSRAEPEPPPPPRVASRSPRNHHHSSQDSSGGKWKRYTDSPGVGSPPPPAPAPPSPTQGRRERRGSPHGKEKSGSGSSSGKVRGVPQSFGYVKRSSGASQNGTVGNGTATPVSG